jgi:spore maturation protein CgeB
VERIDHIAPSDHSSFYARCRFTLNVTRADMRAAGYSPSVRLFEAAAVGTPIISDIWPGIGEIFHPEREIILARDTQDVLSALSLEEARRAAIASAARDRVLAEHTSAVRARELTGIVADLCSARSKARLARV